MLIHAIRLAGNDVGEIVGDLQQLEAVADGGVVLALPDPAFHQQRVGTAVGRREDVHVVQAVGPEHLPTEGVDQSPCQAVAGGAQVLPVDVVTRAGGGVEGVDPGFVGRIELAADHGVAGKGRGAGHHVQQAEAVAAPGVPTQVHDQRVIAGDQVEHGAGAAQFVGLGTVETPPADFGAARADQGPVEIRIRVAGREAVEQQLAGLGQAEGVACLLAGLVDRAAHRGADRQGRVDVRDLLHVEAVRIGRGGIADTALHQEVIGSSERKRTHFLVFRPDVAAPDLVAPRVDQAVGGVVVIAIVDAVEVVAFTGHDIELVEVRDAGTAQAAAHERAGNELGRLGHHIHQAQAVVAGRVAAAVQGQGVVTGRKTQQRVGTAQFSGVGALQIAAQRITIGAEQGPADIAVGQAVEIDQRLLAEREGITVLLPGKGDAAVDDRADSQGSRRVVDNRLDVEAVVELWITGVLGVPDASLDQQRVEAADGERGHVHVVVEIDRAPDLTTIGVDQAPCDPIRVCRVEGLAIEEQTTANIALKAEDVGFVGRIDAAADYRSRRHGRAVGQVQHAEAVVAGGTAVTPDTHLVPAGQGHFHDRISAAEFMGFGVVHAPIADFGATRAHQRPTKAAVVVGHKAVKVQPRQTRHVKGVLVHFAGGTQRARDGGT